MRSITPTRSSLALVALVLVLLSAVGCRVAPEGLGDAPVANAAGYHDLTVDRLVEMLAQDNESERAFTLVNVHVPYAGEISGTDLHIAYDEITENLGRLPAKDGRIVLYCRSGAMSAEAAQALAELGYTDVWELNGGMVAWVAGGHGLAE